MHRNARVELVTDAPADPPGLRGIFWIFFKAGLAFGGGLGILAVLEDELVRRRRLVSRADFLATYGLGRIAPSGTMTAVAVAFGHRLGGWPGTVAALAGLTLPAFVSTVALTAAYRALQRTSLFALLDVTVLPAALALIVAAAVSLGRTVARVPDLALASAALVAALALHANPAVVLLIGGVGGALLFRTGGGTIAGGHAAGESTRDGQGGDGQGR
jgi:chromate transporter